MLTNIPDEFAARQVFEGYLMQDESMLWTGKPDPSVLLSRSDILMIPASLLWGGFAIFWEVMALKGAPDPFFALFGVPFVLMGLYMIFGRFIYKRWRKANTYYAVTNKRVLVLTKLWRSNLQAIRIGTIPTLNLSAGRDGRGTIVFGNTSYAGMYSNTGMEFFGGFYGSQAPTFYDIQDARTVHDLVNKLMNEPEGQH
jgi:hypothetical protein